MMPAVLFIGGMDSSGGAGLLRDCATAAECGVTPRVAVTAVTAQTDRGVLSVHPVPPEVVAAQIAAAGPVSAVKIGMLCSARIVSAVCDALPAVPCVLDPVVRSSSGHPLIDGDGIGLLLARLLPRVDLLTPNLPELAVLAGKLGASAQPEPCQVAALHRAGCRSVLVKGGHATDDTGCEDRLYQRGAAVVRFCDTRLPGTLRGTGCQLASAIAAGLAQGAPLSEAVTAARARVRQRFAETWPCPAGRPGPRATANR